MPSDQRASEVFAELIGAIVRGDHVAQMLTLLTRHSVDLLGVAAAGVIIVDPQGGYPVLAASDEQAGLAELFQSFEGEGPALDVVASGAALSMDLARADDRWPGFAPAAREVGIGWVQALPVRLGSEIVGALNLFRSEAGRASDTSVGQALADLISVVLAQERLGHRAERVRRVLNGHGRIEQAKGILAAHLGCTPARAHAALARHAAAEGVSMADAAAAVVRGNPDPAAMAAEWRRRTCSGTRDGEA